MITVTTSSTGESLTTLAAVKEHLGIVGTSDDVHLGHLIERASAAIEAYCERRLFRQSYTETVPGYGGFILQLTHAPVRQVSTVLLRGETITDYAVEDPDAGWLYRERGWEWTKTSAWHLADRIVSGGELPLFSVAYQAGYLYAASASSEGRTLPADLEQAAIETVKTWHANAAVNPNLARRRIGPLEVEYRGTVNFAGGEMVEALPTAARALCRPYRRVPVV